ncbi:hypothetical protein CRU95_15290 [Arcobacter sp. F2176]|nr:hypothetical protein CRU95_15290 [Arcobacter sp. F2176]
MINILNLNIIALMIYYKLLFKINVIKIFPYTLNEHYFYHLIIFIKQFFKIPFPFFIKINIFLPYAIFLKTVTR